MLQLTDNTLWRVTADRRLKLDCDGSPDGHAKSYWGLGHQQAIRQFYHAITHGGQTEYININEARKSLAMVEAIYHSSKTRQWITINN